MKSDKQTPNILGNEILWAAAMIGSAILLRGTEQAINLFFLLLMLWSGSFIMRQNCRIEFCS